jgi:hypothetical protein
MNGGDHRRSRRPPQRDVDAVFIVCAVVPAAPHLGPATLDRHHLASLICIVRRCRTAAPLMPRVDDRPTGTANAGAVVGKHVFGLCLELIILARDRPDHDAAVQRAVRRMMTGQNPCAFQPWRPYVRRPRLPRRRLQRERVREMVDRLIHGMRRRIRAEPLEIR